MAKKLLSRHSSVMAARIGWSLVGVTAGATLFAGRYYFFVTPVGTPPTFLEVLRWMLAAWAIWIAAAPALIAAVQRLIASRVVAWRSWAAHALLAASIIGLHSLWFPAASVLASPYVTQQDFGSAQYSFLIWVLPLDLVVYIALVVATSRAMSALVSFGSTDDGLLYTVGHRSRRDATDHALLLETLADPVLVYDPHTLSILAVNEAAVAQYGWEADHLRDMTLPELSVPVHGVAAPTDLSGTEQLPVWRTRLRHRRSDGTTFDLEATNHAVMFQGRWARMMLVKDVTEVERARAALAASEAKFRSIFENAVVGIFRSTPEGRFTMLNQSAAEVLGYATPAAAIASIRDIGNDVYGDPAARAAYIDVVSADGLVSGRISCIHRRDGASVWVSENSRGVFAEDGTLQYIEGTVKDVTSEIAAREELRASERRSAELRVQLADAKLHALRLQIKPHFLFNVLNTVAMLIRNGEVGKAQRTVALLGGIFRRFLDFEDSDTVPLEQELEFVDLYLGLEQMRFEDRLVIDREIEPAALGVRVPVLILQPVVENAVRYGVARVGGHCRISLSAHVTARVLRITVVNSVGHDAETHPGHGIGLRNTRARLAEHYGDAGRLEFKRNDDTAVTVLEIPTAEG